MALVILGAIVAGGIIDGFRGAEKSINQQITVIIYNLLNF